LRRGIGDSNKCAVVLLLNLNAPHTELSSSHLHKFLLDHTVGVTIPLEKGSYTDGCTDLNQEKGHRAFVFDE
jgi:hypothetical protein